MPVEPEHATATRTTEITRAAREASQRRIVIGLSEDSPLDQIDPITPSALESRPPERE
jgi:hypothetical protein